MTHVRMSMLIVMRDQMSVSVMMWRLCSTCWLTADQPADRCSSPGTNTLSLEAVQATTTWHLPLNNCNLMILIDLQQSWWQCWGVSMIQCLMFMVMIWECAELMMAWTVSWGSLSSDTDWPHSSSQPGCPPSPGRASLWGRCRGDWWGWSTLPGWRAWRAWRRSSVWRRWPASTVRSFYNVLVLGNHLPAPSYDRVNLLSAAQLVALQSDTWLGWCWWSVAEFSINQITENTERCCHWKLLRLHNFEMRLDKLWKV